MKSGCPCSFTNPKPLEAPTFSAFTEATQGLTSPAGPDHESRFLSGWVDETIVMDESRVERDAISIECDCGELKVQSIVVPLVIADLGE